MKDLELWAKQYSTTKHENTKSNEKEIAEEAYLVGARAMRAKIRKAMRRFAGPKAADYLYARLWDIGEDDIEDIHGSIESGQSS